VPIGRKEEPGEIREIQDLSFYFHVYPDSPTEETREWILKIVI